MAGEGVINYAEHAAKMEIVVRAVAPAITSKFRGAVSASGLKRRSGKSVRGFNSTLRRDRTTGEIWGVTFRTERYVYMHHHGMEPQQVTTKRGSYASKGYKQRGLLTTPAAEGASLLADALVVAEADYFVGRVRF